MLTTLWFFFRTEVILLFRRSQEWVYPLAFFVIVICLFPLSFTPDPQFLQKFISGCIWIAALLASLLSVEHIFFTEIEDGHIEQLLLSQIPLTLLMFVKLTAQWMVTQVPLILLTPVLGLLFHLSPYVVMTLVLGLLLGTPLLTLLGSLGVALTIGLRQQGMLLGLLILPLATPVLIFGVSIVQQSHAGFPVLGPLAFLAGLLMLGLCFLPWTIAATLRVSLDD